MTNRELFAWCLLAFVLGVLCGPILSQHPAAKPAAPASPDPEPCTDAIPDTDAMEAALRKVS